ncbi:ABC transporter permease [Streptomyces millisiae]|uniref:ABC transporter permease subunit n=1 Tax=Streptomyces millisiae TaxID=3075542 RepID=A0ABU2LRV0_9ACTN|nr:ABC transporter permease subunit [Streptomyces sp. DSM 44918]MDT0320319.1 ABC transporter permease subunit [Streptomyces sp. DSM 44918]
MIWLTWRQHRRQLLYTALALLALAALMVPTGLRMHDSFEDSGLADCLDVLGTEVLVSGGADTCDALRRQFTGEFNSLTMVAILFMVLPLLVGLFLGAPLVSRELEHGTHRLVWTQGVSRRRWALTKLGLLGAVTIPLAVAYALGVTWWFGPMAANGTGRLAYGFFDVQGVAPVGYTLFALALGTFAGTVTRRVMPAMALTLGGFVAVRLFVELVLRPHYLPAEELSYSTTGGEWLNPAAASWVYDSGVRNADGELVSTGLIGCPPHDPECLDRGGVEPGSVNWQLYQPGDRFWPFQFIETGVFLALTALLCYLAVRRIRRLS